MGNLWPGSRMIITNRAAEIIRRKSKDQVLLIATSGCYSCSGGGIFFEFGRAEQSSEIEGVKVSFLPAEENMIRSLEIDYRKDSRGGYFSILNQGLYSTIDEIEFFVSVNSLNTDIE